jgi:hypothetical protein
MPDHLTVSSKGMTTTAPPSGASRGERSSGPTLAVIIPTKNRPSCVISLYGDIVKQTRIPDEVVIVDQSPVVPPDMAVQLAALQQEGAPRRLYVHAPSITGANQARNDGLRRTAADLVVFIDDDMGLDARVFERLERALLDSPRLMAASALITNYGPPRARARLFDRLFRHGLLKDERQPIYWNWRAYDAGALVRATKINGGLTMWRRGAVTKIGGFDEQPRGLCVGDDVEISQRLLHHAPDSLAFVGGAFTSNLVGGDWRASDGRHAVELLAAHYLISRRPVRRWVDTLAFVWLASGLLALSAASACRRKTVAPLASFVAAVRAITQRSRHRAPFTATHGEAVR